MSEEQLQGRVPRRFQSRSIFAGAMLAYRRGRPACGRGLSTWTALALFLTLVSCSGCSKGAPPGEATPRRGGLHAVLPSIAVAGKPLDLEVTPITDIGTPEPAWQGTITLESSDSAWAEGEAFRANGQGGLVKEGLVFRTPGFQRVTLHSSDDREGLAGPVRVVASEDELEWRRGDDPLRLFWGDCHGHTTIGDGTHPPEQYLFYARDVAHLDFTCLSEHDFQSFLEVGLDTDETAWESVVELSKKWRRPGFAVLLGWEWSSRTYGHRVVLLPNDETRYVSWQSASTPAQLAEALRDTGAFSVIAHPTGSRLTPAIDWNTFVPGFDRAIEIYSGHGSMDGDPAYRPTSDARAGCTALDAIRRELPLAIVAFSDTHLSTPGNPSPAPIRDAPYRGGLTAVWAASATEREVFEAMRDGRCYATSGERFLVEFRAQGRSLGERIVLQEKELHVTGFVAAPSFLRKVEVMIGDEPVRALDAHDLRQAHFSLFLGPFPRGDSALWLRGESESGERFWTTPIWVSARPAPEAEGLP